MRTIFTAALGLALVLTFSCSSDNDDDTTPSSSSNTISSSGGGGSSSSVTAASSSSSSVGNGGGGSYLSCTEAEAVHNDCSLRYEESFPVLFPACMATCGGDEDCLVGCLTPVLFECFDENGFCGDNSSANNDACEEHYRSECDFMDED